MSETVLMEHMSWPQIQAAIAAGKTTVIVDAGAIEQHGPHLPTGTDTLLGQAIAERAARALGDALVAPVVRPACSAHHVGFPGTLTLEFNTFVDVLTQIVRGLAEAGFKHIALMSSHGGNNDIMLAFLPTIARSVLGRAEVFMLSASESQQRARQALLAAEGVSRGRAGVHAGYVETAMMLYLFPELVDMGRAEPGLTDEAFYRPENLKRSQLASFTHGLKSQSANGILGDPTGATADAGRRLVDLQVQAVVEGVRSYRGG